MLHSDTAQTRVLTLVLPEEEWRALRDVEPDAVGWLQQQVRSRLSADAAARHQAPVAGDFEHDEY